MAHSRLSGERGCHVTVHMLLWQSAQEHSDRSGTVGVWVLLLYRLRLTRACLLCAFRALVGLRRLDIHNTSISGKEHPCTYHDTLSALSGGALVWWELCGTFACCSGCARSKLSFNKAVPRKQVHSLSASRHSPLGCLLTELMNVPCRAYPRGVGCASLPGEQASCAMDLFGQQHLL